jgi:HPt (histidine-containing phosphotransfer) domain-containing protein
MAVFEALMEQIDDPETGLRATLLTTFVDQGRGQIAELLAAATSADAATIVRVAHTWRSSSALLGATVLAGLLSQAEATARDGKRDLTTIGPPIQEEYDRVAAAMANLLEPSVALSTSTDPVPYQPPSGSF